MPKPQRRKEDDCTFLVFSPIFFLVYPCVE